ncbi:MAG: Glu/Leu/Phe/Val dehydrogenase dimerization domain-containing protein [Spirochaetales bacterium]|nr:Glu/Leu/Phe/Val dehydrogenase dimerization domain-containing protein [Spirochaetales bacterium]
MSELSMGNKEVFLRKLKKETGDILESQFRIDINTKDKILDEYFTEGYLPRWYFYSNTAETIAHHIYMLTHFLNANNDMLSQSGMNDNSKTYFINVGRDYPGRLARIIEKNLSMDIVAMDSESTASGLRIVTIDKRGENYVVLTDEEKKNSDILREHVLKYAKENKLKFADEFLETLSHKYMREELSVQRYPERIFRHLHLYEKASASRKIEIESSIINDTLRLTMAGINPDRNFIYEALKYFKLNRINLERSYFDLFEYGEKQTGIFSIYIKAPEMHYKDLEKIMKDDLKDFVNVPRQSGEDGVEMRIETLIRKISSPLTETALVSCLDELKELCAENLKPGKEIGNFYLNSVTDFLEAAEKAGLAQNPDILRLLLGFERFDEFFVSCPRDGKIKNVPGYRIKHSTVRGASKGGLRIDPIVNFCEVAALSFMMTWKSARSRILFGGAKGGLMLNPREYDPRSMDFFDSLSNFGRSLFLVTGPARDVPAGDVGCGADEIGRMFQGFKSALRDLALMVYGVRHNVTMIGDQIISLQEARQLLKEGFNIDYTDSRILKELGANQDYLELVVAAQITGKPKMGIDARTGATGRGMCYATLAAVANLYLEGKWEASEKLTAAEDSLLKNTVAIDVPFILKKGGMDIISTADWNTLESSVFPKLLKGKKMVVQGSGKVGSSIIRELSVYGVNLIAVSDAGGAVIGDNLDPDDVMASVRNSMKLDDPSQRASVIHTEKNVTEKITGAREGSAILELECDLLFPAALENAVTEENAPRIKAKIEVCGSNGSNSSKAEKLLQEQGVLVVYDFLANSAGVTASYFEWLRNLYQRSRYEAEQIYEKEFDDAVMDDFIMPEFRERIKGVLAQEESAEVTAQWNLILRDIMFSALNEDYRYASGHGVSLKDAGFINSQMRVLAAALVSRDESEVQSMLETLPVETRDSLRNFQSHPEIEIFKNLG